ncbi:presqualene diphosphate synthase HpnD [Sphingobium sp. EM0848]|uniref:presqualene diphosphate synthase HpnD n=1 Tax=Sphingobium sp. EM0848 TaxID=2743473 RepID=UPI0021015584|nr:presqualene diphosphate synthase HpnD [Sphingobium sp. EM0848]
MSEAAVAAGASRSSFYAGMRVLPKVERHAMFAIYDFCRIVDDIADDQQGNRTARAAQLDQWRRDLDALYAGRDAGQANFLRSAVDRFDLDRRDFEAVIDGMAMDVDRDICWPGEAELDLYCDCVASAVGRLSVRVFGMEREPGLALSHHLGRALQLTNILRDIDEDAAIGRVYIPAEALAVAGIVPATPQQVAADPRMDVAGRWLAARAERHFNQAGKLLADQPRGLLIAPRLMEIAYARLLTRMIRTGWAPPRQRVRTNKLRLILTVARLMVTG